MGFGEMGIREMRRDRPALVAKQISGNEGM